MDIPENPAKTEQVFAEVNQKGIEFCIVDLELALAMLDRADTSEDANVAERNRVNARRAIEVVEGHLTKLILDDHQKERVQALLFEIRSRIEKPRREGVWSAPART